ncbi:hypothetical protein CC79DRAFT_1381616 [Sarocladium strictum]
MDVALGANQGQGVPSDPLTPGLSVQVVYGKTTIKGGKKFDGKLPAANINWNEHTEYMHPQEHFGPSRLIGVSAAGVVNTTSSDAENTYIALAEESLVDLTSKVDEGSLTWQAPDDNDEYIVFAHYERYSNQRSVNGVNIDVISNGSWVTDHFSAAGAELTTKFWEEHLLTPEIRTLLKDIGQHTWEDSMEIQASLYWGLDMDKRFKQQRGYDIVEYLPLLFHESNTYAAYGAPYNVTFYIDGTANDGQSRFLQNYRTTLNEGYQAYLDVFEDWAESLGLSHSAQVGYGMPIDTMADVSIVAAPELESLGFKTVDEMSQFVGPAHVGRRNIISTEIGAVQAGAYSQTIPSLLDLFHEAFAAGVNSMMIHGATYSGERNGSTWPGFTPFNYVYSELCSPKQPAWEYLSDSIDYTARNQRVLQSGTPKRDLAFYLYKDPYRQTPERNDTDLRADGFTYEYLGPANLAVEALKASGGVLDPSGAAYRALILDKQEFISAEAADKLSKLASEGLPIVVVGKLPSKTIGSSGQEAVSKTMKKLESAGHRNVKTISTIDGLSKALADLAVEPRVVPVSEPQTAAENLYTFWRSDKGSEYIYLYNQGSTAAFDVTVAATQDQVPYKLNAWTGEQKAIAVYARASGKITFQVALNASETALVALRTAKSRQHARSHSSNVAYAFYESAKEKVSVAVQDSQSASVELSNGHTKTIPALKAGKPSKLPELQIESWNLTIESWVPGPSTRNSTSVKKLFDLGTQKSLAPWSEIKGFQNVSGVGIYTAVFKAPKICGLPRENTIAILDLGPALNTMNVWINDKQLPAINLFNTQVDISDFLKPGSNSIRVETASTLFNAVKSRLDYVKENTAPPQVPIFYTAASWQPHGLVGPVRVKVLRKVTL